MQDITGCVFVGHPLDAEGKVDKAVKLRHAGHSASASGGKKSGSEGRGAAPDRVNNDFHPITADEAANLTPRQLCQLYSHVPNYGRSKGSDNAYERQAVRSMNEMREAPHQTEEGKAKPMPCSSDPPLNGDNYFGKLEVEKFEWSADGDVEVKKHSLTRKWPAGSGPLPEIGDCIDLTFVGLCNAKQQRDAAENGVAGAVWTAEDEEMFCTSKELFNEMYAEYVACASDIGDRVPAAWLRHFSEVLDTEASKRR